MALKRVFRSLPAGFTLAVWLVIQVGAFAQSPVITTRFANPQSSCSSGEYCLDVEFKSDLPDQELFGMNVRFFYDDQLLEFIDFRDFQGGYGAVAPDPPILFTSEPAGPALFNFAGPAEFVNGAIQLVNTGAPQIILDTTIWTKLYQICFDVDGPIPNLDTFCPPVVWDLEQDPENGGFLSGDDGVVITIVDPDPNIESYAANENVSQFNWEYIGNGEQPFGQPIELICHNINCALPVSILSFTGSTDAFGNNLEWLTGDEVNALGFDIQRSIDGALWTNIGFQEALGEPTAIHQYQFVDTNPIHGNNYYRLNQKDNDGRHAYSPIIRLLNTSVSVSDDLLVFPNPVINGWFTIHCNNLIEGLPILLIDPQGRIVREGVSTQTTTRMDVYGLPNGVYLILVLSGSQNLISKVLIHQ